MDEAVSACADCPHIETLRRESDKRLETFLERLEIVEKAMQTSSAERAKLLETDQRMRAILDKIDEWKVHTAKSTFKIFRTAVVLALTALLLSSAKAMLHGIVVFVHWISAVRI